MQSSHLNLIKTDFQEVEKRVLPRFPFCTLTFKEKGTNALHAYEVKDISYTGMQLCLKDGVHGLKDGEHLQGELNWRGDRVEVQGTVKWTKGQRLGVQFNGPASGGLLRFLSIENLVRGLRAVHQTSLGLEVPANLRYWLYGDGPVELFVWQHAHGEISKAQIIILHNFVEWEDGQGHRTGRVLTLRNVDTPLVTEDEFVFQLDQSPDHSKLEIARSFLLRLADSHIAPEVRDFILFKLRA